MTKEYIRGNPEASLAKKRAHTLKWHKNNPEKKREHLRKWRRSNPEMVKKHCLEYDKKQRDARRIASHEWRIKNPVKMKSTRLFRKYKLTPADYNQMYLNQNGQCVICKNHYKSLFAVGAKRGETLHVDHCHKTSKIRSLLCLNCNCALGLLKENIQTVKNILKYIEYFLE